MVPKFREWDKEMQILRNFLFVDWQNGLVDLESAKVNEYKYEVNYIPESIIPFTATEKK
ncbi:hypothetical protein [Enterococcus sp. AZ172]|uniref:hypothetical protein n=1 Tax=unclassified Enterococcus TaxID=2608891 RepID=UPI003E167931